MLTPDQIDTLAIDIVSGHQQKMLDEFVSRLVRAMASGGELSVRDMLTLQSVAEMNRSVVTEILLAHDRQISRQVKALVRAALEDSDTSDMEVLTSIYGAAHLEEGSAVFNRVAQETADGLARIIARNNLQMAMRAERVWYDLAGQAIVRFNHGGMSMDRIMRDAINRLLSQGFKAIDYKSGVSSQIDVAVRRHVVSQVNQAASRMTMKRLDQFGHDLVFTSSHFGARPEHAAWQGKVFSLTGKGKPDFYAVTGYGTGPGLAGWNCRHSFGPYFEGITEVPKMPERVNGMTEVEMYEATQKQRGYERQIRDTKREIDALNTAGLDDTEARLKLGAQQRRLKAFTDKTQLPRQRAREKAFGIGRQQPIALRSKR